MSSSVMKIDVSPKKHLAIVTGIAGGWLLISLIVGATAPPEHNIFAWYAYDCPNDSHTWDINTCGGVQLSNNHSVWAQTMPRVELINRFWALKVTPYSTTPPSEGVVTQLEVEVTLLGQDPEVNADIWYIIKANDTHTENIVCENSDGSCNSFVLIYEAFLKYPVYQVFVQFPKTSDAYWVGDVKFEFRTGHAAAARITIGYQVSYFIIAVAVCIFFGWRMKKIALIDWTWEQRAMALLLVGLLCFNNIFHPFRYVSKGWFAPFMSSLLEVGFICIAMLFWLLMADKLRKEELRVEFNVFHIPKLIAVAIYGILALVLFSWASIADAEDPIESNSVSGIKVMLYIVSILWIAIMIWIIVLCVLTVPIVMRKRYMLPRYLFFVVPTGLIMLSNLIAIFAGTSHGASSRTTLAFVYFAALFNTYVYVLLWGYWPAKEGASPTQEPTEEAPLFYNFGANPQRKV